MLVELLSQSNYQSFNIELAHMFGLETSIYLSALIDINEKAVRKNKFVEDGFFSVDRDYITKRTTLTKAKQAKIENELSKINILELSNDYVKLHLDVLTTLLLDEHENLKKDLSNIRKAVTAKSKGDYILSNVKKNIKQSWPDDLKQAYSDWLDAVYAKLNFVNKQMLINAQKEVDNAANHDLDKAIEIINIATANGWKDMVWAVKIYNERHPNNGVIETKNIKVDWSNSY